MATVKGGNMQDLFLNQIRREHIPVTLFLTNGFQYKGVVTGFDNFVVFISNEGKQTLIYKHAIAVISPSRAVEKMLGTEDEPISFI